MAQTPDGFLWLATARKLARFDGVRFEEFSLDDFAPIKGTRIRAFTASRRGGLWLAVDPGEIVYISSKGTTVFADKVPRALAESIVEDGEGAVWVSFQRGPVCRIKEGVLETFGARSGLAEGRCFLAVDREGRIWCKDGESQLRVFRGGRFEGSGQFTSSSAQLTASSSGGLWLAVSTGLFRYTDDGPPRRLSGPNASDFHAYPKAMMEDSTGALWIGTLHDGLYRYTEGNGLERIPTSYPEVISLYEDREGNIWAGTAGGGLNRISLRAVGTEGNSTGLPHQSIQAICEDTDGRFWGATQNGILVARTTGDWEKSSDEWPIGAACVTADPRGGVWVGTRMRPPSKRAPSTDTLYRIHNGTVQSWGPDEGLGSHTTSIVLAGRDGTIWIAGEGPTSFHYLRDGKIHPVAVPPEINRIYAMAEDADGRIWVGASRSGLFRFETDALINVTPQTTARDNIRALVAMPDGTLWLGYRNGGIGRFKNGQLTLIKKAHGLYSDAVPYLMNDSHGWLWCGGDDGVFKVKLQALDDLADGRASRVQSVHYGAGQGLPQLQVTSKVGGAALRSRDGRIWMPMSTALFVADPQLAREHLERPSVIITELKADGRQAFSYRGLLPAAKSRAADNPHRPAKPGAFLQLQPVRQRIEFSFTAPSFSAPENVHFRYRLAGYDDEWMDSGTQRTATYSRLPPGSYQLLVQGCNSDGVWNEAGATLGFVVAPLFWQTWWFRLIAAAASFATTALAVWHVSHRRLQRKIQILRQQMALEKERARIARDLHDDAGNRLTRVMLLSKLALRERENPANAALHLEQISTAAREATDALDEIVWAVNPHNDTLPDLVSYLVRYATELCDAAGMSCRIDMPPNIPNRNLPANDRHNLFLAAKEAIHNAVRHSGAAELRLTVHTDARLLTLTVADNGTGLPSTAPGPAADGLRNLCLRMEEVGGELKIDSTPGEGTRLTFSYPWPPSA